MTNIQNRTMYIKWADVEVGDLVYGRGFYRTVAEVDRFGSKTYLTFVVGEGERGISISNSSLAYIAVEVPSGTGGCEVGVSDLLAAWVRVRISEIFDSEPESTESRAADLMADNYEMYTEEGNRVLGVAVDTLVLRAHAGQVLATGLMAEIVEMLKSVEASGHGECYDTEPELAVVDQINERVCMPMGWLPITRDF